MRRVGTFCAVLCLASAALSIDSTGAFATTNTITTSAGTGVAGYTGDGGQATSAELSTPAGVTVDGAGNVYIADDGDNVVRKIQPSGVITTVAGTGVAGYTGNGHAATTATLHGPTDVVLDSAGNLYIADSGNHVVRKVTPAGVISTYAGNGSSGYAGDNGLATKAKLVTPVGLDIDTAGNLYIADYGNGTVREVSSSGTISTVAGNGTVGYAGDNGPAISAELSHPGDVVAVGSVLYIADGGNSRVREVSGGIITTVAGNGTNASTGDGGQATAASLMFPTGLAADSAGDLFVSDFNGETIRKIAVGGIITTVAGTGVAGYSGDGAAATGAQLNGPARVNLDAAGDLYISDWNNHVVRTVSALGSAATAPGAPTAVTATAGNALADVSWTAPADDGNSPITGYSVIPNDGTSDLAPIAVAAGSTSTTVTGLTNGTTYTFTVTASNSAGTSVPSSPSAAVTPTAPPPSATVPDAPTGVTATSGDSSATVSWTAPANDGGSAITGYSVTPNDGTTNLSPTTVIGGSTTTTVAGLTDGATYTFTVVATNGVGDSLPSTASGPVVPSTVPDPPTGVGATAGDAAATVSWTAPASDGGSAITGYTVTPNDGTSDLTPIAVAPGSTSTTVTGLTNGSTYTFTVTATNAAGESAPSSPSAAVTPAVPATVPGAPTGVSATAGNAAATVSWTAPASDGGSTITGYTVTPNDGTTNLAPVSVSSGTSTTVTGLTNGTTYTFTVTATNSVGTGPASAPSNAVTPTAPPPAPPAPPAPTVPDAPTGVTATASDAAATVSWTAPANDGGSAITGYTVTPNDGTTNLAPVSVSSGTSTTVTGLTNGTAYTFTVTATNAVGTSAPSAATDPVTPTAPAPSPTATPTPQPTASADPTPTPTAPAPSPSHSSSAGTSPNSTGTSEPTVAPTDAAVQTTASAPTPPFNTPGAVTITHTPRHRAHHRTPHVVRLPAALTHVVPTTATATAAPHSARHHGAGALSWHNVRAIVVAVSKKTAVPFGLLLLIGLFLSLQNRLDRRDPKLALAPVYADPGVSFVPAMS